MMNIRENIREVVVGTESAIKLRAVEATLKALGLDIKPIGCKAESDIPAQPIGKKLMEKGATNRANEARKMHPVADLYIGIENGLVHELGRWYDPACVVVFLRDSESPSVAYGAHFPIPEWIVQRVMDGGSGLGHVIQKLAGGGEKDPMKWLSKDTVLREELLSQAIQCALVEVLCPDRYQEPVAT